MNGETEISIIQPNMQQKQYTQGKEYLTPCATFFPVRVRARDRARDRTETTSFAKLLKIDS